MSARILDGKALAETLKCSLKNHIQTGLQQGLVQPALAVILVGNDPASSIYVNNKAKACEDVGIKSLAYHLNQSVSEDELLSLINELNNNEHVHGILVQLPLPAHINSHRIISAISPDKDVDGFHPQNMGALAIKNPHLRPCTPKGIMTLLHSYQIDVAGKHAVIVGASNIVGRPLALELLMHGATISVCHSQTQNLKALVSMADLVCVATGIMDVVPVSWLNKKQIVIDVGIHRLKNGSLRGDIDFDGAKIKVQAITPVPGGVGPMTVFSLLENTVMAAWPDYQFLSSQSNSSSSSHDSRNS